MVCAGGAGFRAVEYGRSKSGGDAEMKISSVGREVVKGANEGAVEGEDGDVVLRVKIAGS